MDDMTAERPESGVDIPAGWHERLWNDVRARTLRGDKKTVRVNRTPNGTTIAAVQRPVQRLVSAGEGADVGVLVSGPSGGYGPAVWRKIKINPNGTWAVDDAAPEVPVIVLAMK